MIYTAEPSTMNINTHRGDFTLLDTTGSIGNAQIDFYIDRSRRYWTEHPQGLPEILCDAPLQLTERTLA